MYKETNRKHKFRRWNIKTSSHPPTASSIHSPHKRIKYPEDVLLDRCGTDQSVGIAEKMLMFGETALDEPVVNRAAEPIS